MKERGDDNSRRVGEESREERVEGILRGDGRRMEEGKG